MSPGVSLYPKIQTTLPQTSSHTPPQSATCPWPLQFSSLASSELLGFALGSLAGSLCSHDPVQPRGTDPPRALRRRQFALAIWKEEEHTDPRNKLQIKSGLCLLSRTSAISPASASQVAWASSSLPAPLQPQKDPLLYCARHRSFLQLPPTNSPEPPGRCTMAHCHNITPCPAVSSFLRPTFPPHTRGKEVCHTLPLGRQASWSRLGLFYNNISPLCGTGSVLTQPCSPIWPHPPGFLGVPEGRRRQRPRWGQN